MYTERESQMINDFRNLVSDTEPDKNILDGKNSKYTDAQIYFFLKQSLKDLNSGIPSTDYTLEDFPEDDLLVTGAIVFSLIAEGLLQLRNQIDYSDGGLAISLFNKTGAYQGWAGFLLQQYSGGKREFKQGIISRSTGAGFYGIRSQFSGRWGW